MYIFPFFTKTLGVSLYNLNHRIELTFTSNKNEKKRKANKRN